MSVYSIRTHSFVRFICLETTRNSPRQGMADLTQKRRNAMKKTIIFALMFGMALAVLPPVSAAAAATPAASADQLWEGDQRRGRYDRRDRRDRRYDRRSDRRYDRRYDRRANRGRPYSYVTTRYVRRWFRTYRETIRVTHLPNGRTKTQVIRRVRVR